MNDMRVISEEGKALIKKFEGCPQKDGVCHAYKDAVGIWTCGYGFIKDVDEHTTMTVEEAEARLDRELQEYEGYVNSLIEVPLEQHQFDSLVSFTYNLGSGSLSSSTLRKVLNEGKYNEVPAQIRRWNKGTVNGEKVVLPGLERRREAEALMWQEKDWYEV